MFVPWCSSGAPVQLLYDSEKWNVWKPRFSKGRQRKAVAISQQRCPWSGQGAMLQGHKKGAVSFSCHSSCCSWSWVWWSAPQFDSTPAPQPVSHSQLSDVWKVSHTDAFSLRRLVLTDAREISRFTEMGSCGIFWTLDALFVSSCEATMLPLGVSAA